jgi:hypothetical protein
MNAANTAEEDRMCRMGIGIAPVRAGRDTSKRDAIEGSLPDSIGDNPLR